MRNNLCFWRSWCCFTAESSFFTIFFVRLSVHWFIHTHHHCSSAATVLTSAWHVGVERVDRWTPRLFGWPPSLNRPRAVDPVWPRGLYSGTGSLCSGTGLPFISHGRLNHVHNLFISIIIWHRRAARIQEHLLGDLYQEGGCSWNCLWVVYLAGINLLWWVY